MTIAVKIERINVVSARDYSRSRAFGIKADLYNLTFKTKRQAIVFKRRLQAILNKTEDRG
jgi:hypothetical protein